MVNFIYGRAGSGKTSLICKNASEALAKGKSVFVIVPEQMAVDTEAKMAKHIGDAPSLGLEILNFRRLCNRVFREYGGISYSYITKSGKKLMMWRTLAELAPMLKTSMAAERGSVAKILGAVSEFKSYRISARTLENAAKKLNGEGKNQGLADRLDDLSLIFASYQNLADQTCDDASDDLTKVWELLRENRFFDGAHVYLDGFNGFTPQELALIGEIFKQAETVTVTINLDDTPEASRDDLFENQRTTALTLKRLCAAANVGTAETVLRENHRALSPELRFMEASLWSLDVTAEGAYKSDAPAVRLNACQNLFAECEAVAVDILKRVREGAAWRDISIITRGVERYDGILDVTLEKYGIPHFASRRVDIKTKPVIKLILSALTMRSANFRTVDVISYIKTGLCGITPDEISELENYAETWRIRGAARWNSEWDMNPDGYTSQFTERSAITLDKVNDIRERVMLPLADLSAALGDAKTVKEHCTVLYDFLVKLGVPEKLEAKAEALRLIDRVESQETAQIWRVLMGALDELCTVLPDLDVDTATFTELLKMIFDETDIGRIPGTIDEVTFGDASLIRAEGKHVYIIGANEGIFPLAPSSDGVFSDKDRAVLAEVGVELADGDDAKSIDERFTFYRAAACASESVFVTWSCADLAGRAMKPSFAVTRLLALFPCVKVTSTAELSLADRLEGRANLLDFIAEAGDTPLGKELRLYAEADGMQKSRIDKLSKPLSNSEERLSEETCKLLFPGDIALTKSRLDKYVLCHFSYFCSYVLKLKEQRPISFDAADIGTFVHHILEVFTERAANSGSITDITDADIETMVDDIVTNYMKTICRITPDLTGSRLAHLFARLKRSSKVLCKNLVSEFSQSRFIPAFRELPINFPHPGETAVEPLSVKLDDGSSVYLHGIADRVDVLEHGDKYYVRVVDYKTGSKDFSLDNVAMGLDMQLFLYLFSMWKNGANHNCALEFAKNSEILPAGVLYFSAGVPTITLEREETPETVEAMVTKGLKRSGLLLDDREVLSAMDSGITGTYIPVKVKKDGDLTASSSVCSLEDFSMLLTSMEDTIKMIGAEIKGGNASAHPICNKKNNACKFCEGRPICRLDKSERGV